MQIGSILTICGLIFILFWIFFVPIVDAMFPNEDARLKPIAKWEEENMTNKERVAKWREEQKKSD